MRRSSELRRHNEELVAENARLTQRLMEVGADRDRISDDLYARQVDMKLYDTRRQRAEDAVRALVKLVEGSGGNVNFFDRVDRARSIAKEAGISTSENDWPPVTSVNTHLGSPHVVDIERGLTGLEIARVVDLFVKAHGAGVQIEGADLFALAQMFREVEG